MRALLFPLLALLSASCTRPRDSQSIPSAKAAASTLPASTTSSAPPLPSAPVAAKAAPIVLASERAPLFPAVEGNLRYIPLIFENKSLLLADKKAFSIESDQLKPLKVNVFAGLDTIDSDIVAATGKWPERAWLLTEENNPCVPQNPTHVLTWSGARWTQVSAANDDAHLLSVCRFGERHFGLRREEGAASFVPLDGPGPAPPGFEPAPSEVQREGCRTRLDPERCVSLAAGDLVVLGTLCGVHPTQPAIEHFEPATVQGKTVVLPVPEGEASISVTSFDARLDEVHFAGTREKSRLGYFSTFSTKTGMHLNEVPSDFEGVDQIVAVSDGSLWFKAPPVTNGIPSHEPSAGLWRRTPRGEWQALTLAPTLEDGKHSWQISRSIGLLKMPGEAWFDARYTAGNPEKSGTPIRRLLLRSQPSSEVLKLAPPSRVDTRVAREVPCGP